MSSAFSLSYSRAAITWIFRNSPNNRTLLVWVGAAGQAGLVVGVTIVLILTDVFHVFFEFKEDDACPTVPTCDNSTIEY